MAILLNTSRFKKTSLVRTRSGRDTYGIMKGYDRVKNISGDNFTYYTVKNSDLGRPDLLAFNFYGNPHLEWVIVMANKPKNPLNWPEAGDVIKIPNSSFVRSLF